MEDGVDLLAPGRAQQLASLGGGQLDHLNPPDLGQVAHLVHHWEAAVGSGTDHQPRSRPGDLLVGGQRGVSEPVPVRLRGALFPTTDPSLFNYYVVVESQPGDDDLTESGVFHIHQANSMTAVAAVRRRGASAAFSLLAIGLEDASVRDEADTMDAINGADSARRQGALFDGTMPGLVLAPIGRRVDRADDIGDLKKMIDDAADATVAKGDRATNSLRYVA